MYNSPVTLIENISNQMMIERENAIVMKISEQIGIDIDKEELIKAMNYDRNQYEKGYADAKAEYEQKLDKIKEIVNEWIADSCWSVGLSYECMIKISDLLVESEEEE